jgi:hypothetical protein
MAKKRSKKNPCKGKTGKVLQTCIKQYEYEKQLKKKDSAFNKRFKEIKSKYDESKKLSDSTTSKRFEKISNKL